MFIRHLLHMYVSLKNCYNEENKYFYFKIDIDVT